MSIAEDDYPAFDNGEIMDVWVKTADGVTSARGRVWPDDEVNKIIIN